MNPAQEWDPAQYAQGASFVPKLGEAALAWLAPQPGERILDLGCGDGALTQKFCEAGCEVVGVDASAAQVSAARARGLDARCANGEALNFRAEFDAVFSNAALHWMKNADAVLSGVRRALRPGGRFAGEFGGKGNVAQVQAALEAELAARGLDGAVNVLALALGDLRDDFFGGRVDHIEGFARRRRHPLAAYQHLSGLPDELSRVAFQFNRLCCCTHGFSSIGLG